MSEINAQEYLKKFNLDKRIIDIPTSSATVSLAAKSLGCEEARIAKTLALQLKDKTILIVTAGDVKIDNAKYKNHFKEKAKMLNFDKVEEKIGHAVGGVCPFGINSNVDVYLDEVLKRFATVFPACGNNHSAIELSINYCK